MGVFATDEVFDRAPSAFFSLARVAATREVIIRGYRKKVKPGSTNSLKSR